MTRPATSSDLGYQVGELSVFPQEIDSTDNLYRAGNNAEAILAAPMNWSSDTAILSGDVTMFPTSAGVLRIADELVYYEQRIGNRFIKLHRGFAGTSATQHSAGRRVTAPVIADMHNAVRDALLNIQRKVGLPTDVANIEDTATLFSRKAYLEAKWLTPRAEFFSHNRTGHAPLGVQFWDFSYGEPIRWLWEFGDGQVSSEQHPFHVYTDPGSYTVQLTVFSNIQNGVSLVKKKLYVVVEKPEVIKEVLFYAETWNGRSWATSLIGSSPLTIRLTDQTPGDVRTRLWTFGDGNSVSADDPSAYRVEHTYERPGRYVPALTTSDGVRVVQRNLDRAIEVLVS